MKHLKTFFLLCSVQATFLFSQNETQKWYFGNKAGLDFSTNPPTILTNGMMMTSEGCATMSDNNGNLLFYTDGSTVYDQTHAAMANGTGLLGFSSSSQSGIIVKQPGNVNIYYVFTQGATGNGVRYSIVDMSLAAGMGSVTVKNVTLSIPSSEKLTSVKHCNGVDVWVLTHDNLGQNYKSFLVTAAGVNTTPVVSAVGTSYVNFDYIGCLKTSPNGKKLATGLYGTSSAGYEIYDFDNSTGIISNSIYIGPGFQIAYGVEFSPDGTKLYGTRYGDTQLYQWDLCAGSATAIIASQYTVSSTGGKGQLQTAANGKIYVARPGQTDIGVIHAPNLAGAACNYIDIGQSIAPKISTYGLPNFINSFFKQVPAPFTFTNTCQSVSLTAPAPAGTVTSGCSFASNSYTNLSWDFGDPSSGTANTSTLTSPSHTYSTINNYTVQLILYYSCSSDTLKQVVPITSLPPTLNVSGTFSICNGEKKTFTVSGAITYTWHSNNSTVPTITLSPNITTVYSVTATGAGSCQSTKTFSVFVFKCTDVKELLIAENELTLNIYPNPSTGNLYLETEKTIQLSIYNSRGELVENLQLEAGKHTLDISRYSTGIYSLRAKSGRETKMMRLVKSD